MKRYNLSKARKYIGKDGSEKTYWDKVGEMVEFDNGNRIVKIPAIGLEANVFEDRPKESGNVPRGPQSSGSEEINPEGVPF